MLPASRIYILLAAYNGARFIAEQLRSIQRQTVANWTLLIRDDGSQDGTLEIILDFARADARIHCIRDGLGRLGIVGNFAKLMCVAKSQTAQYVFFSDQDDVWMPTKIADQISCLTKIEASCGPDTPSLVYSDLEVVNDDLQPIHPSYMRYQRLVHEFHEPSCVLVTQNLVTGCAVVVNRALLDLAVPVPEHVVLHDWWLALCAAACGKLEYSPQVTVRYRQHLGNQVGAEGFFHMINPFSDSSRRRLWNSGYYVLGSMYQAASLSERIASRKISCSASVQSLLAQYSSLATVGRIRRLWGVARLGLRRQGLMRWLLLCWRLLTSPRATFLTKPDGTPPIAGRP